MIISYSYASSVSCHIHILQLPNSMGSKSFIIVIFQCLEPMQNDAIAMTNFLIDEETFDIGTLITGQLYDFSQFFIFLDGSIARKILFEGFANAFNVQIIRQTGDGRNTFASVSLLDANVNFVFRGSTALIVGRVLKGVYVCFLFFCLSNF